jgi:hypothetical protein
MALLPDLVDGWTLRNDGDDFGRLSGLSLDGDFLDDILVDDGASFGTGSGGLGGFDLASDGGALVDLDTTHAGVSSMTRTHWRCIDESHPLQCNRCVSFLPL